ISVSVNGVISFRKHFQAEDSDIILAPYPKSGTTWIKALTFTIVNRSRYAIEDSPLLTASPHQLKDFFSTHVPYASVPSSILESNCRIVYICTNPLGQFIARRNNLEPSQLELDEAFERTCNGIHVFGPIWEHVLGYWKASIEQPGKILFLKYENLGKPLVYPILPGNSLFLRKGEVGNWKNYLSPSMSQHLQKVVEEKLDGPSLTFKTSLEDLRSNI
ncbi:hypothetical protein CISIN_1g045957mg, partial [Citrus sinensis]